MSGSVQYRDTSAIEERERPSRGTKPVYLGPTLREDRGVQGHEEDESIDPETGSRPGKGVLDLTPLQVPGPLLLPQMGLYILHGGWRQTPGTQVCSLVEFLGLFGPQGLRLLYDISF